jgi:hypothetical protein
MFSKITGIFAGVALACGAVVATAGAADAAPAATHTAHTVRYLEVFDWNTHDPRYTGWGRVSFLVFRSRHAANRDFNLNNSCFIDPNCAYGTVTDLHLVKITDGSGRSLAHIRY